MNLTSEHVYILGSAFLIAGLSTLGLAAALGVIAVIRIGLGEGKVRGYPHAFFSIFWSGTVAFVAIVALLATSSIRPPGPAPGPTVKAMTYEATFVVEIGELEFIHDLGEFDQPALVARIAADLAKTYQELRQELAAQRPRPFTLDVGVLETRGDSNLLTFRVSTDERSRTAFEFVASRIKRLTEEKLDTTLLKQTKSKSWSVSFEIE
jgi:hypothetical protein